MEKVERFSDTLLPRGVNQIQCEEAIGHSLKRECGAVDAARDRRVGR